MTHRFSPGVRHPRGVDESLPPAFRPSSLRQRVLRGHGRAGLPPCTRSPRVAVSRVLTTMVPACTCDPGGTTEPVTSRPYSVRLTWAFADAAAPPACSLASSSSRISRGHPVTPPPPRRISAPRRHPLVAHPLGPALRVGLAPHPRRTRRTDGHRSNRRRFALPLEHPVLTPLVGLRTPSLIGITY